MGDRCNIVMRQMKGKKPQDIFFYGHWCGSRFIHAVHRALKKKWRWDDPAYLSRIIWDEFCPEKGQETSFGISVDLCDNEHDFCIVDCEKQLVIRCKESTNARQTRKSVFGDEVKSWSFDDFIQLSEDEIDGLEW